MSDPTDDEVHEGRERASMEEDLQHERDLTARTADAERMRAAVREAVYAELTERGCRGALGNQLAVILDAIATRAAAQLTAPAPAGAASNLDEVKQLKHHIASHRATCSYSCSLIERLLASAVATPPGHVCPVPYGLGPDDLDILEDLADMVTRDDLATEAAGATTIRAVLIRILATHRAPVLPPADDAADPDHFIA